MPTLHAHKRSHPNLEVAVASSRWPRTNACGIVARVMHERPIARWETISHIRIDHCHERRVSARAEVTRATRLDEGGR